MNANAAFILWITAGGLLSPRDAHRVLAAHRAHPTAARVVATVGFAEFEALRNPAGGLEFQGLLCLESEGADLAPAEGAKVTSFFPAPQKHRGGKTSAKRHYSRGEGSPCRVAVENNLSGQAGGVTGEGVRASGASSAPRGGVVSGEGLFLSDPFTAKPLSEKRERQAERAGTRIAGLCDFSQKSRTSDETTEGANSFS